MRFRNDYSPYNTCDKIAAWLKHANHFGSEALVCGQGETGLHECMVKRIKMCCESLTKSDYHRVKFRKY